MKFSDGCWLKREGIDSYSPTEVYDSQMENEGCTYRMYAPAYNVYNRGCTLGGVVITIRISTPAEGVFKIALSHFEGERNKKPQFNLDIDESLKLDMHMEGEDIVIVSGSARLRIEPPFTLTFFSGSRKLTSIGAKDIAYIQGTADGVMPGVSGTNAGAAGVMPTVSRTNAGAAGIMPAAGCNRTCYMSAAVGMSVGEHIYGLGERFGEFVKNGQSIQMCNRDGGTSTEQAYKNVPFFISDRGYGIFVNNTGPVEYEIGSEYVRRASFCVEGEKLEFHVICGEDNKYGRMKDVLHRYTKMTGRAPILPAWTFGLWLSTSFTTDYDEDTVMGFLGRMKEEGIPVSVFHFDCFWMKGMKWCNFIWDKDVFPDPQGMIKRIKETGVRICVWINPYIAQNSELFCEGRDNGYFIKKTNGDVWQWDMWQSGMAIVDFTNPAAKQWYQGKLEELLDMGIDCFKTDFGERIPVDNVVYHDGSDPKLMHNYYSYMYNEAVFEVVKRKRGEGEAVLFARSATAGGQKFPVHWGGDCTADYESMADSLRGGLSLMMSGFSFWSHDIGGFEDTSTDDVYKRWVAFGLMSSHSRMHGSSSYRVPWNYGKEAVETAAYFTKLKNRLMPYIYSYACLASETGIPLMRSMVLEFTDDRTCAYLDCQYMLGPDLLVAPVFSAEGEVEVYLPQGTWTGLFDDRPYQGGKWHRFTDISYLEMPCFVRQGAVIPVGSQRDRPDYDYMSGLTLMVYKPYDGMKKEIILYGSDGRYARTITVESKKGKIISDSEYEIVVI